jgi:hypothetical protein
MNVRKGERISGQAKAYPVLRFAAQEASDATNSMDKHELAALDNLMNLYQLPASSKATTVGFRRRDSYGYEVKTQVASRHCHSYYGLTLLSLMVN